MDVQFKPYHVREVVELVDDENVRARVAKQACPEASFVRGDRREVVDERGARRDSAVKPFWMAR